MKLPERRQWRWLTPRLSSKYWGMSWTIKGADLRSVTGRHLSWNFLRKKLTAWEKRFLDCFRRSKWMCTLRPDRGNKQNQMAIETLCKFASCSSTYPKKTKTHLRRNNNFVVKSSCIKRSKYMRTFLSNTFSWRSKRPEVFKKELFNVYKTYWKDL